MFFVFNCRSATMASSVEVKAKDVALPVEAAKPIVVIL
jgi:hypothetical protein